MQRIISMNKLPNPYFENTRLSVVSNLPQEIENKNKHEEYIEFCPDTRLVLWFTCIVEDILLWFIKWAKIIRSKNIKLMLKIHSLRIITVGKENVWK